MKNQKSSSLVRFIENTGWMLLQNIYSMLISLILGAISARYLGPTNYGTLNYGTSIISFFSTVSKLGLDIVLVAEMVRTPKKESTYLGTALLMRFITSIISFFAICAFIIIFEPNNKLLQVVTILQAVAIIFQSMEVLYFWFQAHLEMKYITFVSMITLTITSIWRITLLANSANVQWFALSASISALVSGIAVMLFFVYKARLKLNFALTDAQFILSNSYHFIINSLAVTLYSQLDRIMIGKTISPEAVGFYSAAATIAGMWQFLPSIFMNSARPLLTKLYDSDKEAFIKKYQFLMLGISSISIAISLALTIFSRFFIFTLYGENYYESIPALSILTWATAFSMLGVARGIWIVAERKNKYMKYFTLIGAFINVSLNIIAIPAFGLTGAAITTLISQISVSIVIPYFFKETRDFVKIYFNSFKLLPEVLVSAKDYITKKREKQT